MRLPVRLSRLLLPTALGCALRTTPAPAQADGPEFQVNGYTTGAQSSARIAADSAGNFVVVWHSYLQDGQGYGVFGQRYGSAGAPLGTEFQVNTGTTNSQAAPSVASDVNGNFVVVWSDSSQDGSSYGVFGLRFGGTGTPLGQEFRVNTYTTGFQRGSSVASDAVGNFVVVWRSYAQEGPGYGLFGQRFGSTGVPLGPEFRVNTYTTGSPTASSVASDAVGNCVVVWESFSQDGSNRGVFGQRYGSAGVPLGPEFRVNSYTTDIQRGPSVASDLVGNFVVVWESLGQDGSNLGVFGQRYDSAGAPLGTEFRVSTFTTNSQSYASVASDSDGSFVVVWQSLGQDGSNLGVFGQRFDSAGAPLGTEFLANTQTTNRQTTPSVASRSGGRFVVVWASGFQDGSSDGVFGQRFCRGLASVTLSVSGSTTVCTTSTGGTATVTDSGGGAGTHQWAFRTMPGTVPYPIPGQTATSYVIDGADFPGAGVYSLLCSTNPECGSPATSNGITVFVTDDPSGPVVTSPNALTTTQTLCE